MTSLQRLIHYLTPPLPAPNARPRCGEPFAAQTTGPLPRPQCLANTRNRRHSDHPDLARPLVRGATSLGHRPAKNLYSLVSPGGSVVLEVR
jgi:hypothetical protein